MVASSPIYGCCTFLCLASSNGFTLCVSRCSEIQILTFDKNWKFLGIIQKIPTSVPLLWLSSVSDAAIFGGSGTVFMEITDQGTRDLAVPLSHLYFEETICMGNAINAHIVCTDPLEILVVFSSCALFLDSNASITRPGAFFWSGEVLQSEYANCRLYAFFDDGLKVYRVKACDRADMSLLLIHHENVKEPKLLGRNFGVLAAATNDDAMEIFVAI
ncbi:unnamed protein product [Soboliphyme baturini]|uniref:CNH domain-containing protein n=1 Tax=Soboliphyme baturini TaxID=241478 RepID=A0A183ITC7_9BILA|nr:unnamed protein product [Soboliphyme baturini]